MIITRDEAVKALNEVNRVFYQELGSNSEKVTLDFARTLMANVADDQVLTHFDFPSNSYTHILCDEDDISYTWAPTLYR